MQLARNGTTDLTITGNIKTTADYLEIREMVTAIAGGGAISITIHIRESLSMPSSVIGFFVKLVNRDKVKVTMLIQDHRLLELLEELSLAKLFGARLQ